MRPIRMALAAMLLATTSFAQNVLQTVRVDAPEPPFILHATAPLPVDTDLSKLTLRRKGGREYVTQVEVVARTVNFTIVELFGVVTHGSPGVKTFELIDTQPPNVGHPLGMYDLETVRAAAKPDTVRLVINAQDGTDVSVSLTGLDDRTTFYRGGHARITAKKWTTTPYGDLQWWVTLDAGKRAMYIDVNLHNGSLPARPDAYFASIDVKTRDDLSWSTVLPDPACAPGGDVLVKTSNHILPQRWERPFRIVVHEELEDGEDPPDQYAGWGVADWTEGGWLTQTCALPDLKGVNLGVRSEARKRWNDLKANRATSPGQSPVSFLYPARGTHYGGMTGGIDVEQYFGVRVASSTSREGLDWLMIEQLRYASRQMGCIYEDGDPLDLSQFDRGEWRMFNNRFQKQGGQVQDEPFRFDAANRVNTQSTASYNPAAFDPIDYQHFIRRTKANKALVWLTNDPIARLYVMMDATLSRMTYWDKPGKAHRWHVSGEPERGKGTGWGRGEAWCADIMATAYTLADDDWRDDNFNWLDTYARNLALVQLPSGLFGAQRYGKMATDPPYNGNFYVHRSNEQAFTMFALGALDHGCGIPTGATLRKAAEGMWSTAWDPGGAGCLERYPAGPIHGPRYAGRADFPDGLVDGVWSDAYQVGTTIGTGWLAGVDTTPALLAFTGASSVKDAARIMKSWGIRAPSRQTGSPLANWCNTFAVVQQVAK